jgi:very-short-patch-repair endonuclease
VVEDLVSHYEIQMRIRIRKQNDAEKQAYLVNPDYNILRYSNEEVMNKGEIVLSKIKTMINVNTSNNSPDSGVKSPV